MEINEAIAQVLHSHALDACIVETHGNDFVAIAEDNNLSILDAKNLFYRGRLAKKRFSEAGIDNVCDWIEETFPQELF